MTARQPAICPDCGSSKTARVLWGELVDPGVIPRGWIAGGCCIPVTEDGEEPEWGCEQCGAYFSRHGEVTGRAHPPWDSDSDGTEHIVIDD